MKKAVIFAPFWRQAGHVGNNRVDRFVRWLAADGFHVIMIRAGSVDGQQDESWGIEITVRDLMGLYRDSSPAGIQPPSRKPNKFRRQLSYWMFNPDPSVVWARMAARHPSVLKAAGGAAFILSSSPPESAHVGAWNLSRRLGLPHIVDMRDGWLDEPLKPMLRISAFRRWQEGRLEARILNDASSILVTSNVWQELLCNRMPALAGKVSVLTNGYPLAMTRLTTIAKNRQDDKRIMLIHAGRFLGSRLTQSPDLLLQPLLEGIKDSASRGTIKLIGPLSPEELKIVEHFAIPFSEQNWLIECPGSLPRHELLQLLPQADGLLLLSNSFAAIPSKLFEYIPTGRPILAVTDRGSATWQVCEKLPQATLVESRGRRNELPVQMYLRAVLNADVKPACPVEFTENHLSEIMRSVINGALA